jgi:hypothetical protein
MDTKKGTDDDPAEDCPDEDYAGMTNDELYRLLCRSLPHMAHWAVTDSIRQTIIAMLRITAKEACDREPNT